VNEHARAALEYIERGWSVIPLVPGTKRPAAEVAPYLSGERRIDRDSAFYYWCDREGVAPYGIGIVTGDPSGLLVVDVDPRNGGDVAAVAAEMPHAGYRVRTAGGGMHFYVGLPREALYPEGYQTISPSPPKGKTSRPGVDRCCQGGYVVAPPSVVDGRPYVAEDDGALYLACPTWVHESPPPAPRPDGDLGSGRWVADVLARPEEVLPGSQEETLTRLAWWAAGHLDEDVALAILQSWVERVPLGRENDPWTEEHVADRLRRAYLRREPSFAVGGPVDAPRHDPAPALPVVGSPLASLEFPDQDWIVADFVAPGAMTEVIGKVKKGKSTLVYQLVRSIVRGEPFLGRATAVSSPVVLMTEQSGASLRSTVDRSGLARTDPVYVIQKPGVAALGSWAAAVSYATDVALWIGARVLIVDTLSRLARLAGDLENSSGSVSVLDPFDRARAAGLACLFVRHARKVSSGEVDDIADAARGSSAITGDMDIVIRLRPHQGGDLRVLSWESRLTDDPEDVTLRYVDGRYEVTETPEPARVVEHNERLDAMRRAIAEDHEAKLADLQRKLGWSHHTVAKYKRIVDEGEALPAPGGAA